MWLSFWGVGLPLLSPSCIYAMLSMLMHLQRPCLQVCTTVRGFHPYPMSRPVCESPTSNMLHVRCFQLHNPCVEGAAEYSNRFTNVCPKRHPVKQTVQGIKRYLQPDRFRRCNQSAIRVEKSAWCCTSLPYPLCPPAPTSRKKIQ